eukprot:m.110820 g.110820  ORF g.110820 m.110820 type:complete len:291 (-) comp28072_c1_seq1:140-1012(-)
MKKLKTDPAFERITQEQWTFFDEEGYVILNEGQVLPTDNKKLDALRGRIDDIMLGKAKVDYDKLMMQLDSETGNYQDIGVQTLGHKGESLNYRKIQNLEHDDLFREYIQHPIFEQASRRSYGDGEVSAFRIMFFNKPAGKGTHLPWHQDRWQHLNKDPLLTVWTALDDSSPLNGCVQVVRKSHKGGVINRAHHSSFLTEEQVKTHCVDEDVVDLELKAGQVALLHNWTIHRSGVNNSKDMARRAFSVNYMDGTTQLVDQQAHTQHMNENKATGYAEGSNYFHVVFPAAVA